ncbi:hypothetical protein B0T25DRAFT_626400 [Lasiosphaeria hispida]|uniref:Uncharacterized protein n=1 Tax=Lasiosphaeria hispida TaxID=260671 RepID=A0AAJ0H776_9PEZI|nr:hypothetical protein B0T25DRAFT_626400 [Lasiosphaeria hispida]
MASGQVIAQISRSDLITRLRPASKKITELKHLASYNWLDRSKPTILVPGSPPRWSPPSGRPPRLEPDSGLVYIDQNAARNPRYPLEPLFRALYVEQPEFDIQNVDLVSDRNNIRKLLRFVQGSSKGAFQIRVEIAGENTALFTRVEAKATEYVQGFQGYGRNFEKAYTKKDDRSSSHHRIVGYSFGGMKCIVRHETDGYVSEKGPAAVTHSLSGAIKGLSISESRSDNPINNMAATMVETSGTVVDLASTLEIKTRAASREVDMAETLPQLWISQTPKLVVGYHRNGVFDNFQLREMTDAINRWEELHQSDIGNLACLLTEIIAAVKRGGNRRAVVSYTGGPNLIIVPDNGFPALPKDLHARWEGLKHQRFRQFFRRMPTDISDYRVLFRAPASLPINVLAGGNVRGIMDDMRRGKDDWDPDEGREIDGLKGLARDSAFRLLYLFLVQESWHVGDQKAAYNAALFAVSHPRIFRYRTLEMNLDKWSSGSSSSDEDMTTEGEVLYDSNDSYFYYSGLSD